jgi:hypothetical protein
LQGVLGGWGRLCDDIADSDLKGKMMLSLLLKDQPVGDTDAALALACMVGLGGRGGRGLGEPWVEKT